VVDPTTVASLDHLLAGDAAALERDEATTFDRLARGRHDRIVLLGSGGLGRRALAGLRAYGVEPLAFADNSVGRQGTTIDGVRVMSPMDAAREFGANAVFVVTIWGANSPHRFEHSREQLRSLGCDVVVSFPQLFWKYPRATLPHYLMDLPHRILEQKQEVRAAYDLWEDDASRAEYVSQVRFRLLADFDGLSHPVKHPQYFPDDLFAWRSDEWILDGGAYDGDTVRTLVELHGADFGHLHAFEPDPSNFAKLTAAVAALPAELQAKFTCSQVALASEAGTLHLDALGNASSVTSAVAASGTIAVPAETIDVLIGDAHATFLKLDIEGAEPDALVGARRTIERDGPVLAICVYHRQDHLWSIPLMLRAWRDDYAFYLRPHNEEGWDLICYAVPRARLSRDAP
jgi:FkbM family methyltransferase